jgi:hypothetical protein
MQRWLDSAKQAAEAQLQEKLAQYDTLISGRLRDSLGVDPDTNALIMHRNRLEQAWYQDDSDPFGLLDLARRQYQQYEQSCEMLVEYEQC